MRSQLSVWCVQAVPVSGCGIGDYSSVTRWMVVQQFDVKLSQLQH